MRRWIVACALLLALGPPRSVSASDDPAPAGAQALFDRLSEDGPEARDPAQWRRAARALTPAAGSPTGGAEALYRAGICSEKAFALSAEPADRKAAEEAYERVADAFPAASIADDALLRSGRLREVRGDLDGARAQYRRLLADHPSGDVVPLARRRLEEVGKPAALSSVRAWSGPGYTRVVVDVEGAAIYSPGALREDPAAGRPYRIFLDFARAEVEPDCKGCLLVGDGLLRQVRTARFDPRTVRVVLDLEQPASFRVFRLDGPSRVVLDVFQKGGRGAPAGRGLAGGRAPPPEPRGRGRPVRIVVDPGHGGADPGALGPGGLREKDVVLAIARELGATLRERLRCEVKFTRETDRTVSLEERTAVANAFGADLFVSVHANASPSRDAHGIETYYLARASDRAARALAARENASGEEGVSEIEHILTDVLLTSKVDESQRLARAVQDALVAGVEEHYGGVRNLGVKKAPFYVLTGASMPAVLVETAFISHPAESKRLADPKFRARTAQALSRGLERFLKGG